MATIKDGQISFYCHFNKIIKGSEASFQSPALSQRHVKNVCHTAHQYLTKYHFDSTQHSKETSISVSIYSNAYDDITDFEICGFQKVQKSRYLENETLIFLRTKHFINYTLRATLLQRNSFAEEVTFKD